MSRVVLAMSGGVDSSVAAHLLRAGGPRGDRRFHAAWRAGRRSRRAATATTANRGIAAGRQPRWPITSRAAARPATPTTPAAWPIGWTFRSMPSTFRQEFGRIIDYFIDEYTAARTPNPCVMCNNWIKFGRLFDYADSVGAEFVATGHYARLVAGSDPTACPGCAAASTTRRTSRTSCSASSGGCLPRMMLPVGDYRKTRDSPHGRARSACAWPTSATARRSASCPSGDHADVHPPQARRIGHGRRDRDQRRRGRRPARRPRAVHHRPAQGAGRRAGRAAVRRPARARNAAAW